MIARYGGAFGTSMAIHAAVVAWLALSTYIPPARGAKIERKVEVVLLAPPEDSSFPGVKPVDRTDPGWQAGDVTGEGQIAGADIDRIGAHLPVLFPFVTPGLALDAFFPAAGSPSHLVFENPFAPRPRPAPSVRGRRLELTDQAIQALVDKSWTRARRWGAFEPIGRLVGEGDANDDRLARLVALYRDQNALQPYADGAVRDLRLWAQLGLAADHISFISFIREYAASHPSSTVTTELLFLL